MEKGIDKKWLILIAVFVLLGVGVWLYRKSKNDIVDEPEDDADSDNIKPIINIGKRILATSVKTGATIPLKGTDFTWRTSYTTPERERSKF